MNNKQPIIYAILISIGIYIGNINNKQKDSIDNKINNILQITKEHYVDTLNYAEFEEDAINTILNQLDPHSSYISTKNFKNIKEDMQGAFSGIGVEFNIIEDTIVVISPISGGPSEKLGIKSGDRIVMIEKENVAGVGIKNQDVIDQLRGTKGSSVNISIKRRNQNNLLPFKIIRDNIPLHSVDAGIMLTNDIGYIKVNRFAATTYEEMMKKANNLILQGMNKLILDLRNNPGGYLHIANQICDEFLEEENLIVFTQGRNRNKKEIYATKEGDLEDMNIIALINEGSASASEIVAGALQDNDRGLIIGRRSFGKGLVQEQINLHDGSVIRLTTQRYYTPSGRSIQKKYTKKHLKNELKIDTNKINESLRYTTKNGRTVYAEGGINPDIIINLDTNLNYFEINKMIYTGLINKFCLEKGELLKKENVSKYTQINMTTIYNDFIKYRGLQGGSDIEIGLNESIYLKTLLLANISRHLWGNNIYYKILSSEDEFIQKAISEFETQIFF